MQKAMYGLLRSALSFYRKLVVDLENAGFKLNLLDPCVSNKTIHGTQMTVCWHMDNLESFTLIPKRSPCLVSMTYGVSVATH
jgi:hypothetical protein